MQQEHVDTSPIGELSDDAVQQMLELAERLKTTDGGELDEAAIEAVAEATSAPIEYVRLALRIRGEKKKKRNFFARLKTEYFGLEPEVRRNILGGLIGAGVALAGALPTILVRSFDGMMGVVQILLTTIGVFLVAVAKDARSAAITGAVGSGFGFLMYTVFLAAFQAPDRIEAGLIIPTVLMGALGSIVVNILVSKNRTRFGLKDPVEERQQLLKQLVELQTRLKSGEQLVAFLSVDIVGSTRIKELADPLSIEYTFTEYHQFVERITRKYGGRVHSTAGDGLTCAFDTATQAFNAAKNIQAGMIELNTFGNKTGIPLVLRAGVHAGTVLTPTPGDISSLNFAHVIDIAAHMQKLAPPGGIVVSTPASEGLPGGPESVGRERVVTQNVEGIVWSSKAIQSATGQSAPPPLPPS